MKKYPALVLFSGSRVYGNLLKNDFLEILPLMTIDADTATKKYEKVFVFFEYVGNNSQTLDLLKNVLPTINATEFYIVIDDCYEGLIDDEFLEMFKNLLDSEKRITDFTIMSSNKILGNRIEKYFGNQNNFLYFNIHLYLPDFDSIFIGKHNHTPNEHLREKKFLCVNRQERVHRLRTVDFLAKNDMLKHSYVSCTLGDYSPLLYPAEFKAFNADVERYQDSELPKLRLSKDSIERLKNILPLDLDVHEHQRKAFATSLPSLEKYFDESYFSIVTEGDYYSNKGIRQFTEKVLKCFAYHHPFVVVGLPGTLELLREQGFITFSSIIDESYDLEENDDKRLNMALKEIEKLNHLNLQEMKRLYNNILPILKHNYLTYKRIYEKPEPSILVNKLLRWAQ